VRRFGRQLGCKDLEAAHELPAKIQTLYAVTFSTNRGRLAGRTRSPHSIPCALQPARFTLAEAEGRSGGWDPKWSLTVDQVSEGRV